MNCARQFRLSRGSVPWRRWGSAGGLGLAVFPLSGLTGPQSAHPASPQLAPFTANLQSAVLGIAVVICVIVCSLLLWSMLRFRGKKSAGELGPAQGVQGGAILEMIWTIIPVGILLVLLVLTYQTF